MHIALIPARKGSEGFKNKNRLFFSCAADFLNSVNWMNRVIVSTDDPVVENYAKDSSYEVHKRPKHLAGSAVSIKEVFSCVIEEMGIDDEAVLWLFYLPLLYRRYDDLEKAKQIIEQPETKSLCSFIPAKTHPFNCWQYDREKKALSQYVENDVFRRQDLPEAWMHHHYLCCFKAVEVKNLNSELINKDTFPFFIDENTADKFIEIDTPQDYDKWKSLTKKEHI